VKIIDNNKISNQKQIANIFNNYLLTIADTITSNNNHGNTNMTHPINYLANSFKKPFANIHWQYNSTYEITKTITSLKTKNSCGYNEISNHIIKLYAPFIISPLTYICNAILITGIFAERLKYALVKPVFRKENRQEIYDYRPISPLTSFSKIIEKLICTRLHAHTDMNNMFVQEQYGFRTHSSNE
jgi:Notch-like protein